MELPEDPTLNEPNRHRLNGNILPNDAMLLRNMSATRGVMQITVANFITNFCKTLRNNDITTFNERDEFTIALRFWVGDDLSELDERAFADCVKKYGSKRLNQFIDSRTSNATSRNAAESNVGSGFDTDDAGTNQSPRSKAKGTKKDATKTGSKKSVGRRGTGSHNA